MKYEIIIALIQRLWKSNLVAWSFYAGQTIKQEIWATEADHKWGSNPNPNQKEI